MSYAFIKSSPNPLSWAALKQPVKKHAKQNTYPHKGFKEVQLETGVFFQQLWIPGKTLLEKLPKNITLNFLPKLNSNRNRQSNEHEIWLFTSATILCTARFAVVNVCACTGQQKCPRNAPTAECLCSPTPQGVHVPTAAGTTYLIMAAGDSKKNCDSALRSYTGDTRGILKQKTISSSGPDLHFWFLYDSLSHRHDFL